MLIALEAVLAVVAGVFAGLTGGGGGVIFVPVLIMMGLPPTAALATSNVSILITTTSATISNARRGLVPWRRVGLLAVGAVVTAPVGAYLALRLPGRLLLAGLIALNIVNLIVIERRSRQSAPSSDIREAPESARATPARVLATGASGGAMAGLFGVGGGIIMVPLQVGWLRTPIRAAARISLAVIIATSGGAVLGFAVQGGQIDWLSGLLLGVGGIIGAPIGARVLRRISAVAATRILQVVIVAVTVSLVARVLAG